MSSAGDGMVSPLDAEPSGAILWLWLPSAVLGHVFAAIWLRRAVRLAWPSVSARTLLASAGVRVRACVAAARLKSLAVLSGTCMGVRAHANERGGSTSRGQEHTTYDCEQATHCSTSHGGGTAPPDVDWLDEQPDGEVLGLAADADATAGADLIGPECLKLLRDARAGLAGVELEWHDVCCTRRSSGRDVRVLWGVHGHAGPREMVALMGASGAGKSTLLDILAMRGVGGSSVCITGSVLADGALRDHPSPPRDHHGGSAAGSRGEVDAGAARIGAPQYAMSGTPHEGTGVGVLAGDAHTGDVAAPAPRAQGGPAVNATQRRMSRSTFLSLSAYVPQHDHLSPQMTVCEVLWLHATLLLPPGTARQAISDKVEHMLSVMGLQRQKHTLVGGTLLGGLTLRGISGGERRRLAIGAACVASPLLLFLDEPTSGLDSFGALRVAAFLRALADAGHTLLVSIHQPRAGIWGMFDRVVLLSLGMLMYEGPVNELVPWLTGPEMNFRYDGAEHGIVPDWAIDIVSGGTFHNHLGDHWSDDGGTFHNHLGDPWSDDGGLQQQQEDENQSAGECCEDGAPPATCSNGDQVQAPLRQVPPSRPCLVGRNEVAQAAQAFALNRLLREQHQPQMPSLEHTEDGVEASTRLAGGGACVPSGPRHEAAFTVRQAAAANGVAADVGADVITVSVAGAATDHLGSSSRALSIDVCVSGRPGTHPPDHQQQPVTGASTSAIACAGRAFVARTSARACSALRASTTHARVLFWRECVVATRNPVDVAGRMLLFLWIGLFANMIVYSAPGDASSMNVRTAWYFSLPFFYLVIPFVFISLFSADKRACTFEIAARLYKPGPFYMARVAAALPFNVAIALTFGWLGYGMFGFRHSGLAWVQSTACSVLFSLISLQWMHFAVTLSPNVDVAFVMAVGFTLFNVLINGFFMSGPGRSQSWISKLRYISALDWCWQGCMRAEFAGRVFVCSESGPPPFTAIGLFPQLLPDAPSLEIIRQGMLAPGLRSDCVADGDALLAFYGVSQSVGRVVAYLLVYLAVLHVATFAALLYTTRRAVGY